MALEEMTDGNTGRGGEIFHRQKGDPKRYRPAPFAERIPGNHRTQWQREKYFFEVRLSRAETDRGEDPF